MATETQTRAIECRARIDSDCLHGSPVDPEAPPSEDGTFDPATSTIVCDACYVNVIAAATRGLYVCFFSPSGRGLADEIPAAIVAARAAATTFPGGVS